MATLVASLPAPPETKKARGGNGGSAACRTLVALLVVLVVRGLLAVCLISALQLLSPRQMPFGVVGPSLVVQGAQSRIPLAPVSYPSKSAAVGAIDRGQIYGALVTVLWFRNPHGVVRAETEVDSAAMTVPIGAAP